MLGESHGNVLVPDGIYEGKCTGIKVKFNRDATGYEFEMVRVTNEKDAPVKIVVNGMKANVYKIK